MTTAEFENLDADSQMELYETIRQSLDRRCADILRDSFGLEVSAIIEVSSRRGRDGDMESLPMLKDGETVVDVHYRDSHGRNRLHAAFPLRWLSKDHMQ